MNYLFDTAQLAVMESAENLFRGSVTSTRVRDIESSEDRIDRQLWSALGAADLLSLAIPPEYGGGGLGMSELALLLSAQGALVAPVPIWATLVTGALPIAFYGSAELKAEWLPKIGAGEAIMTAALAGPTGSIFDQSSVILRGGLLSGFTPAVPYGHVATAVIMRAKTEDTSFALVFVDAKKAGIKMERVETTNREIHPNMFLDDVEIDAGDILTKGDEARIALDQMCSWAFLGLSALMLGVCKEALSMTASYLNERIQFDRPLATFQGVLLRAADAAIDLEAMSATLWQAAWLLDLGEKAKEEVAIAKWHAAERGQRIVHAVQHLHGGIGADISYPIHRYFLWGKQLETQLGSPAYHLSRLGDLLANRNERPHDLIGAS